MRAIRVLKWRSRPPRPYYFLDCGQLTITNSTISGNIASAVRVDATISSSTISGNTGAGVQVGMDTTIAYSTISRNSGSGIVDNRDPFYSTFLRRCYTNMTNE